MNPVASQTTGSSDAAATALQGATLAFNKNKPAPPPTRRGNGPLTPSAGRPRSPTKPLAEQSTGESATGVEHNGATIAARLKQLGASPVQLHPGSAGKTDARSASFIAATLAASRSASPSPKVRTRASSHSGDVVDSGSIPPTGNLISMFEQARTGDPVKRASPKRSPVRAPRDSAESIPEEPVLYLDDTPTAKPKPKPKLKPKPRPMTPPPLVATIRAPEVLSPKPTRPPKPVLRPKTPPKIITRQATQVLSPPSPDPQKRKVKTKKSGPPTPPQPRGTNKPNVQSQSFVQKTRTVTPRHSAPQLAPRLSRPRPDPVEKRPSTPGSASSNDTFVSASSVQSPERLTPPTLPPKRRAAASTPSSPSREVRRHRPQSSSVTNLPLESLTSAIVAGSLASARLTPHNTGGSLAPQLPRRQKSPRMMQTLRQPAKASDEDLDRHKKKPLHKLHSSGKHSHHEGSRKKWREEITPRERKRYEAVWASNRGLLLDYPNSPLDAMDNDPSEYVVNVIAREIWKRSRLPADELAEVWDLVDRKGRGILGRAEFVVGMWLIDQRLRGRKIPAKVSDSVWGSANGMKVIKPRVK
ncbi:hypothetical protein CDV36_009730 [Fusarium kuroshium]|uniref:EH domain-containing protein n=1 Tax=Fusarium kuroshium TaxID=2010991 RepID=A0A3M2RZ96_9HYPO|nr:hypothetical protein CDV36_009730 [Fusarium kuroshium]